MLLIPYLYQQGAGALDKNKWGAHRGADYFFYCCILCVMWSIRKNV